MVVKSFLRGGGGGRWRLPVCSVSRVRRRGTFFLKSCFGVVELEAIRALGAVFLLVVLTVASFLIGN